MYAHIKFWWKDFKPQIVYQPNDLIQQKSSNNEDNETY